MYKGDIINMKQIENENLILKLNNQNDIEIISKKTNKKYILTSNLTLKSKLKTDIISIFEFDETELEYNFVNYFMSDDNIDLNEILNITTYYINEYENKTL
jgi:hypothetical protein